MNAPDMTGLEPVFQSIREKLSGILGEDIELTYHKRITRTLSTVVFFSVLQGGKSHKFIFKKCKPSKWDNAVIDRTVEAEHKVLNDLYAQFREYHDGSVPKPVLYLPEYEAVVMEAYELPPLSESMKYLRYFSSRPSFMILKKDCARVGSWLKHLFRISDALKEADTFLLQIKNECLRRIQEIDESGSPMIPSWFNDHLSEHLETLTCLLAGKELPVCGVHGDFGPQNILHSPEKIIVIDWFSYHEGPVCCDATDFLLFLDIRLNSPVQSTQRIRALINSFWEGYGSKCEVPQPLIALTEFQLRLRNLYYMVFPEPDTGWKRTYVKKAIIRSHLKWFYNENNRNYLWAQ